MTKALRVGLTLLAVSALCATAGAPLASGGGRSSFGTVAGTVRDNKGNPLAGAVISLVRDGANEVVKQTVSAADGSFTAKIAPGRYTMRAVADGFSAALFSAVLIRPSDEVIYRFNLEPIGAGRTAPERRADRDNAKWRVRAAQNRRSIFNVQEDEEVAINTGLEAEETADEAVDVLSHSANSERKGGGRTRGVVETYFAASNNTLAPGSMGMNFAIAQPFGEQVELIFAGQTGVGIRSSVPQRLETSARVRAGDRHRVGFSVAGMRLGANAFTTHDGFENELGQLSVRAIDEWVVRDGVVVVLGLDYSRFIGAGNDSSISPRFGMQYDADARTRVKMAFAPGGDETQMQSAALFEDGAVVFRQPMTEPMALVDGHAVMERSRRFEFGVERILNNESSVEATAFFDTTSNRGVGLLSMPLSAFLGENGEELIKVANQQGAARGLRVVYTRRISRSFNASAGYSFGRGQRLSPEGLTNPAELFSDGFFQTAAFQMGADFETGTHVRTVFRFSPQATVFAIDPFAGRLAVYDPSLSILVTQDLPTFGLPVRAEAVIDARNLLDTQTSAEDGETLTSVNAMRRSVRGGISVRF